MRNKQLPPSYQRFAVTHHRLPTPHCIAIGKRRPNVHTKRFATCPTRQRKSKLLNQCDVLSQQSFKSAFSPYTGACFCVQHTFACLAQTCHKQTATKACHLLAKHAHLPTTWWQKHKKKALPCGKAFFCRNNIPSCLEIPLKKRKKDKFCACPFLCN